MLSPLLPYEDQNTMLEELYAKFNVSRPDDFTGHSLSVSAIVHFSLLHKRQAVFLCFLSLLFPPLFTGHSLSVSDIVALRQNGVVSCHYVDSQVLPGALPSVQPD